MEITKEWLDEHDPKKEKKWNMPQAQQTMIHNSLHTQCVAAHRPKDVRLTKFWRIWDPGDWHLLGLIARDRSEATLQEFYDDEAQEIIKAHERREVPKEPWPPPSSYDGRLRGVK